METLIQRLILRFFYWLVNPEDLARAKAAVREWWGKMKAEFRAGMEDSKRKDKDNAEPR